MYLNMEDKRINYSGRIDFSNPQNPEFIYPASSIDIHFIGKSLSLTISNQNDYYRNFIGIIVDDTLRKYEINISGETKIEILNEYIEKEHFVKIYKAMDACHIFKVMNIEVDDEATILKAEKKPKRKIEFYGDSITAGEITEADDYIGMEDPLHQGEYSNVWHSYSWMTARKLNAEIHNIAQGGIALLSGSGWYQEPEYLGMMEMWDHVHYSPKFDKKTMWNFSKFKPDVVVVAIGQNDSNPEDYMAESYDHKKANHWRAKYESFIRDLRSVYPKAWIILQTTLMTHHENWDKSIEEACERLNDDKIKYYKYKRNGKGTPGHLRIVESEEMANELSSYIEKTCYK